MCVAVCYRRCHNLFSARQALKAMVQIYTCESHFRTCVWRCVTEDAIACSYRRCHSLFSAGQVFKAPWKLDLPFLFFFFFVAMCMVSMHVCVHVCRCIRGTCMSRSQSLHFLQALAELRTHPFWLVWLGDLLTSVNSLPQESLLSSSPVLGFKHAVPVGSSGRFWGSRLWSWCLSTKPSQLLPDSILLRSLRFLLFCGVGIPLRPSHILGKCWTTKVHLQPIFRVNCLFFSYPPIPLSLY